MGAKILLRDKEWEAIEKVLPNRKRPWRLKDRKGGRYPLPDRQCFEGILWILWTGAPWESLPKKYGSKSAVHNRLREWVKNGVLFDLWRSFLTELDERQQVAWNECFIDGTFASAKKGALRSVKRDAARAQSSWYWPMARVLRSEFTWTRRRLPR
jgi:transposase